jgi:hypothetical protein
MKIVRFIATATALALLAGCASPPVGSDAAADASPSADVAATDATALDTGAGSCGAETCGADQVCVRPCCGGANAVCVDRDDAGMCPPGADFGPCQMGGMFQQGCRYTCTPPPPFCAPIPASGCNGTNCALCPSGNGRRDGTTISCLCA